MSIARWTTGHPLSGDAATRDCLLLALEAVKRRHSSLAMTMSVDTSVGTVGSKKVPPRAERLLR